eukprot:gene7881-9252_t
MELSSYSSSIQKTSVFINPQLEITNGGISYFSTFLSDLTNSVVIETINHSKQANSSKQKYLSVDSIQEAINRIFSHELSEYIIDQSQGRLHHTSLKNLPTYTRDDDISSDDNTDTDEDDADVEGFEIIPRDTSSTVQSVSLLFFPVDLVFQVTQDMIKRKKVIFRETDFYESIEFQTKDSFIYTFLSYCMEVVTSRILKRISDSNTRDDVNEDLIRKTISDDNVLKEIRHKVVHVTTSTNRFLSGGDSKVFDIIDKMNTQSELRARHQIPKSTSSGSSSNSNVMASSIPVVSPAEKQFGQKAIVEQVRIPSLLEIERPFDLLEVLRSGNIHLEATNGTFLVFLILLGLALQSMGVVCEASA